MNSRIAISLLIVAGLSLTACATTVPISGETKASALLKSDTVSHVSFRAKIETKCDSIESINTEVLKVNAGTTGNGGVWKQGSVQERWTVNMCGQAIPYLITFTPDGQGGTYFSSTRATK